MDKIDNKRKDVKDDEECEISDDTSVLRGGWFSEGPSILSKGWFSGTRVKKPKSEIDHS